MPSDTPEAAFGRELRRLREQSGLSLRELARRVSRSHSNLWDYERGHRLATPDVVADYERVLGLSRGALSDTLEQARLEVYGPDRSRRRPYRPGPTPQRPPEPPVLPAPVRRGVLLLGRDPEMAVARQAIADSAAGDPRFVEIVGDAGIGKSTLVTEMMIVAAAAGFSVFAGACTELASVPYLALITALRPLLEAARGAQPGGQGAPGQVLDLLLGTSGPAEADQDGGSMADRTRLQLFYGASEALFAATDHRPCMLVVEDLHWGDPATLSLLDYIVTTASQRSVLSPLPLLVAVTTRHPVRDSPADHALKRFERESGFRDIGLDGLPELAVAELIHHQTGSSPSPPLLRSIATATRGCPLLVRSVIRRLEDEGVVRSEGRRLTLLKPEMVGEYIELDTELTRHVAAVPPDGLAVLEAAAVIGEGTVEELRAVLEVDPDRFDSIMQEAAESGLLREEGDDFCFVHPQIRHVVERRLPSRRSRRMHRHVAERLENYWGDGAASHALVLSRHLLLAGTEARPDMARRYAQLAAEQAFAVGAWGESAANYDSAVAWTPADSDDLIELRMRSAVAHFRDHNIAASTDRLGQILAEAKASGDRRLWGRAALLLARCQNNTSAGAEVLSTGVIEEYLEGPAGDDEMTTRAWSELAINRFSNFDFQGGMEAADRAIELAEKVHDDEVSAQVHVSAGIQQLALLRFDEAERSFELSSEHATRLQDPWASSWGSCRLPLIRWARGDLREADRLATEAAELARSHFDWAESALALAARAGVAAACGRFDECDRLGTLGHQHYLRSDYIFAELLIAPSLIAARALQGDAPGMVQAVEMLRATGVAVDRYHQVGLELAGQPAAPGEFIAPVRDPASLSLFDVPFVILDAELADLRGRFDTLAAMEPQLAALVKTGMRSALGWPAAVERLLGLSEVAAGKFPDGIARLRRVIGEASQEGSLLEVGRTAASLALAIRLGGTATEGARVESQALTSQASEIFGRLGAEPMARRVLQHL